MNLEEILNISNHPALSEILDDYSLTQDAGMGGLVDPLVEIPAEQNEVSSELYEFKVTFKDDKIIVAAGSINEREMEEWETETSPEGLWLKATVSATTGAVSEVTVVTANPSSDTASSTSRSLAVITWEDGVPSISQGIKGSIDLTSCGPYHYWNNLY